MLRMKKKTITRAGLPGGCILKTENVKSGKTYYPKGNVTGEWYVVDATGKSLGRLATKIAEVLVGKHRPPISPPPV